MARYQSQIHFRSNYNDFLVMMQGCDMWSMRCNRGKNIQKKKVHGRWVVLTHMAWMIFAVYQTIEQFYAESEFDVNFSNHYWKMFKLNILWFHLFLIEINMVILIASDAKSHDLHLIRYVLFCSPISSAEAIFVVKNVCFRKISISKNISFFKKKYMRKSSPISSEV